MCVNEQINTCFKMGMFYIKITAFSSLFLILSSTYLLSQNNNSITAHKTKWYYNNPFEQKVFIENKGQFDNQLLDSNSKIFFSASSQGVKMFFTSSGLTYRYDRRLPLNEAGSEKNETLIGGWFNKKRKIEKVEREDEIHCKIVPQFLSIEWVGANKNAKIISENIVTNYYTYSSDYSIDKKSCIKAAAYKKLIYKNLYPNIDLEYIMPKDSIGIEYSFIIHPGGNPNVIKMKYNGDLSIKINSEQCLEIKSEYGLFTDHPPIAYYADNKEKISATFAISKNNQVGFKLNNDKDFIKSNSGYSQISDRTIIIDPWSTTPNMSDGKAFDINYDVLGNVYVSGEMQKVAKFNNAGVLQWTYSIAASYYSDFAVDELTSEVYMFNAPSGPINIYKIDAGGIQIASGSSSTNVNEVWRAEFDRCNNQIIVGSGSYVGGAQAFTVDKNNLSNVVPKNVFNESDICHDIALTAIDDDGSSCYFLATQSVCGNAALHNNEIVKCPLPNLTPSSLSINSGFTFKEVFYTIPHYTPPALGGNSHGFNGMKVRGCYLYGYDGQTVKIWDKLTGALIQSITVGGGLFDSGGLDVDECGNIYAGNGSTIKIYDADYSLINTLNLNGTVYDLRLGLNNNIYACGNGFLQEMDLSGNVIQLNATLIDAACNGCNGSAQAQLVCNNTASSFCTKYVWSTGATTQTVSNLCAGTYIVSVQAGCGTSYADTVVILSGIPPNVIASVDNDICIGSSTPLSASGALTYIWTPGNSLNDSTIASPTASPTVTTNYIVAGYNVSGCADRDTVTITVHPKPQLAITAVNVTCYNTCNGQITVIPNGGTAPYLYSWTSSSTNAVCTNLCPGSYTVTVTDAFGCTNVADTGLTEPLVLTASTINLVMVSCKGECDGSATDSVSGGIPGTGYSYSWSTIPVQTTASATGLCSGNYTCTVTDSNSCTTTTIATITEPATVLIAPIADITICPGGNTILLASASGGNPGGYNYSWDAPNNLGFATTDSVNVTPVTTTSYTVNATDVLHGCPSSPIAVSVIISPPLTVIAGNAETICSGSSTIITALASNGNGGPYTYSWAPSGSLNNAAISNPTASPTVNVTYTVTANDGCSLAVTDIVTVQVLPLPDIIFGVDINQGCVPLCVNFTDASTVSGGSIASWNWDFGDGSSGLDVNPSHCFNAPGQYSISLIATSNSGCIADSSLSNMITVFANPLAAFNPIPNPATIIDPGVTMSNESSADVNYWNWNFGDGVTLAPATSSPVHIYPSEAPGSYLATLIVHNANACYDTISHEVIIGSGFTFFIPNSFTPNGDGINDYFFGSGIGILKYDLWIFDRWGQTIFHGNELNDKWDGKASSGKDVAQTDVYVWKVELTDVYNKKHSYIGIVTLVK